jgi:hypothetical protein
MFLVSEVSVAREPVPQPYLYPDGVRTRSGVGLQRGQQLLQQHRHAVLARALEQQQTGALREAHRALLSRHSMHSTAAYPRAQGTAPMSRPQARCG